MVPALPKNERIAGCGSRSPNPLFSRALGESLRSVAGEHPRLVHQPSGVVGTPHTGVVSKIPILKFQIPSRRGNLHRVRGAPRFPKLDLGVRNARDPAFISAV